MNLPRKIRLIYTPFEYDDKGRKRIGKWSQAYSGERYWSLDPLPEEVHVIDIVQGLANANRYRGQTLFPYNVATHSVLVSEAVERIAISRGWSPAAVNHVSMEGLFHDAPEAYLGDVARPLKRMRTMREYCRVEGLWEDAIFTQLGIKPTRDTRNLVHEVDHRIVLDEIQVVMRDPDMWARGHRYVGMDPLGIKIPKWNAEESKLMFYTRFNELKYKREAA